MALAAVAALVPGALGAQETGCPAASGVDAEAGWTAYQAGDMAAARARFDAALARCPDDHYARTGLGYVALREGDEPRAERLFQAALDAEPDNVDALVGLGLLAWRRGDLESVRRRFEVVQELVPDHPTAREYLELVRAAETPEAEDEAERAWRSGDHARAATLFEERVRADSTDAVALHRLALAAAWDGRYDEAHRWLDRLVRVQPGNLSARVDRARFRAWQGEVEEALGLLEELLDEHPGFLPALEARALFEAWAGRYEESLSSYDDVLAIAPGQGGVRRQQAQVLAWASRLDASRALFDSLLAADPDDVEARLGLARTLTFADELEAAEAEYRKVLEGDPDHVRALQGLARAQSWGGKLRRGEETFRRALEVDPTDVATLVGLAQNLRWQGRNPSALEVVERAEALAPADNDVREQRRWIELALGTQLRPSYVVEDDSDDNHMESATLSARWHPVPRLGLRADLYRRRLTQNALERWARGLTVSASWQFETGWTLAAGLGAADNDGAGRQSLATWLASLTTPGGLPAGLTVALASTSLDATAALAQRGVRLTELDLVGRWTPSGPWRVDASVGGAELEGSESNRRLNAGLSTSRRTGRVWRVGLAGRVFGFDKDLADGYFDPDRYAIGEVTLGWLHEPARWSFLLEGAPGVQQVGSGGDPSATVRVSARMAYDLGPGREIAFSAGYSSAGLQSFSTGDSDYRYTAFILSGGWVF